MNNEINSLYEFGEFQLDTKERVLLRENETIILAPKVFDTLEVLLKSDGKIVSKDDLMNEIWEDSFVEEGNLTQNIYVLRQTLGKDFIKTVPRRGYRFASEVKTVELEKSFAQNGVDENAVLFNNGEVTEFLVAKKSKTFINEEYIEEDNNPQIPESKLIPINTDTNRVVKSRKFQFGLALGVVAAVLVGTFGFFVWQKNFANAESLLENVKFTRLTDSGDVENMAISPDGQFLAVVKKVNGKELSIWIKDINSKQELPLKLSNEFTPQSVDFSPDGNSIYFLNRKVSSQGAEIYKTTRFGGTAELVGSNVWSKFSVSPDGDKIAFYRELSYENKNQIIIQNIDDKSEKVLITTDFPNGFELRSTPVWSTDGKEIYAISRPQRQARSNIVSVNIESGKETIIDTPKIRQFNTVIAHPNGQGLIFSARERRKFPQIYKMNKAGGDFQRLTNDLNVYRDLSLSKDGKNLVALQKNSYSHIWFYPESSIEKAVQLTFGKAKRDGKHGLDILPDGKIVFTSLEDMNRDLWTVNPKDGSKQQLTTRRSDINERPFVSNDGNYIYFDSLNKKNFNIERIGISNPNIEKITNKSEKNDFFPTVSPDETTLYFVRFSKGKSAIYKKTLPDGEESEVKLPEGFTADSFVTISPDGRFLAVRQADQEKRFELEEEFSNSIEIGIIPLDKSDSANAKTLQITTNQSQFRWNETSDAIYFIKHTKENTGIWKKHVFAETESEKIFELPNTKIYHFKFSSEKGLAASVGKHIDDVVLINNFE